MKTLRLAALVIVIALIAVALVRQMQSTASDSNDASTAAELRVQIFTWFQDKREYPASLEQIWNTSAMRDYRARYGIPDEKKGKFTYAGHSNWYEMSFTNFGTVQYQVGSNGLVVY